MKILISTLLFIVLLFSSARSEIIYTDPKPGAEHVNVFNTIVIGTLSGTPSLYSSNISVSGSKQGNYSGNLIISGNKLIFKPHKAFALDETVTVYAKTGNDELNFSFRTQSHQLEWNAENTLRSELGEYYRPPFELDNVDPPEMTVTVNNNPAPGKILMGSFGVEGAYLLIAENNGTLHYSQNQNDDCYDFKRHDNGTFTYFSKSASRFYQLDSNFNLIDSFFCGNGYLTDLHEIVFAPNGNVLLMSYDIQFIDMSKIVPKGDTLAKVTGLVIQELDHDRNVVFQWRSWDHFQITDAEHVDLTAPSIDYVHGNAIEVDTDGNILISSRHMSEITKIDRSTGNIIWRLGGKNNQFSFINDPIGFSYQHDIRRISNGNVTLYDNGNYHTPQFSRALEYQLDEINKKATLVWSFRHSPDVYGFAMGSTRRLPNGNTIIGWGYTSTTLTEVTPSGQVALEMKLPSGSLTYRVTKSDWDMVTNIYSNSGTAESYNLNQNYPNPFNPSTVISFSIPESGEVSIKVFDIMGREVGSVFEGYTNAGSYNSVFDGSGLASGIYIYKMQTKNFSSSKKMILMK